MVRERLALSPSALFLRKAFMQNPRPRTRPSDYVFASTEIGDSERQLAELVYAKQRLARVRWVLAVPEDSPAHEPRDLEGKVIATEVVHLTEKYLQRFGVKARVEFSWGATEVKVPQLADTIVEEAVVRQLLPKLKAAKAQGIVEYPLNKIVL